MGDRSVHRDHEIEASHGRRRVDEGVGAGVEIRAQRLDPHRGRQARELFLACAFLQGNESHACDCGERRECGERRGAGPVGFRIGVALPDDADLEALRADPPGPQVAQSRLGREIGDGGRNGLEPRAKSVGQAADCNLRVEKLPLRRPIDESR